MTNPAHEEDIFYSDDEFSDSEEIYQVPEYFSNNSNLSTRVRQNSNGALSPETSSPAYSTIDRPITQISMGIGGLGLGSGSLLGQAKVSSQSNNPAKPKSMSWSSVAKKEPLQPQKANIIKPKLPPLYKAEPKKSPAVSVRVPETALMAGYRFRARDPQHDPRYPQDQQLMVGPIPGHLDHDVIYNGLRSIFQARGPVCFMFLHKNAVKDNDSGAPVKFGYVVFAEKGATQKVLKEKQIAFNGGIKIDVTPMA